MCPGSSPGGEPAPVHLQLRPGEGRTVVVLIVTPPNSPQYPEQDRYQYGGGRRQDVLQGQFVDVRQQQQQLEEEVELLEDSPVPVVIRGLQILPNEGEDAEFFGGSGSSGNGGVTGGKEKPAFSFDNDTTMNLDGPGYALSLLLIGEIVILAMAFFSGGLGSFTGRSFTDHQAVKLLTGNLLKTRSFV